MKIRQDKKRKKLDARFHGVFTRVISYRLTNPPDRHNGPSEPRRRRNNFPGPDDDIFQYSPLGHLCPLAHSAAANQARGGIEPRAMRHGLHPIFW
jgi:hypothetical protein